MMLNEGDFVVDARGRRYFSNEIVLTRLREMSALAFQVSIASVHSASAYKLDQKSRDAVVSAANQLPRLATIVKPAVSAAGP
jgi:hypothetical protein